MKCPRLYLLITSSWQPGWETTSGRRGSLVSWYLKIPNWTWIQGQPIAQLQEAWLTKMFDSCPQEPGNPEAWGYFLLPGFWKQQLFRHSWAPEEGERSPSLRGIAEVRRTWRKEGGQGDAEHRALHSGGHSHAHVAEQGWLTQQPPLFTTVYPAEILIPCSCLRKGWWVLLFLSGSVSEHKYSFQAFVCGRDFWLANIPSLLSACSIRTPHLSWAGMLL